MKNFHLPLPEETYAHLRAEAERRQVPATTLAREAVDGTPQGRERPWRATRLANWVVAGSNGAAEKLE